MTHKINITKTLGGGGSHSKGGGSHMEHPINSRKPNGGGSHSSKPSKGGGAHK